MITNFILLPAQPACIIESVRSRSQEIAELSDQRRGSVGREDAVGLGRMRNSTSGWSRRQKPTQISDEFVNFVNFTSFLSVERMRAECCRMQGWI